MLNAQLMDRFAALVIRIGQLSDSGNFKLAEGLHPEFETLRDQFLDEKALGIASLESLMMSRDAWVRFLAATALMESLPEQALAVLDKLGAGEGVIAVTAQATVGSYRQERESRSNLQ